MQVQIHYLSAGPQRKVIIGPDAGAMLQTGDDFIFNRCRYLVTSKHVNFDLRFICLFCNQL